MPSGTWTPLAGPRVPPGGHARYYTQSAALSDREEPEVWEGGQFRLGDFAGQKLRTLVTDLKAADLRP